VHVADPASFVTALAVDRELTDRIRAASPGRDVLGIIAERRAVYVAAVRMARSGLTAAEAEQEVDAARPELRAVVELAAARDHAIRSAAAMRAVLDSVRELPGVQAWLADHDRAG
jgi:hypothetical protein